MRRLNKAFSLKLWLASLFLMSSVQANAIENFVSATLDNDVFVGKDNGYTNGIYFSFYNVASRLNPSLLVRPLLWSMPNGRVYNTINVNSIGQTLTTAEDITQEIPPDNSLPYSGLLKYTNAYVTVGPYYADWVSTSLGIVGPAAKGEQTQNGVHRAIGVKEAQGWDTQLKNEVVFGFSRGRAWRVLATSSDTMDLLVGGQVSLGTITSGLNAGVMLRVGQNLQDSYATVLLANSRASNPIGVNNSWFIYAGLSSNYIYNQIFTDGNTFRDSRSIDYDHNYNTFTAGITYSVGGHGALTFAYNSSFSEEETESSRQTEKLSRYGTLTLAWQI
ncbi:lipid A deacylase LpxR family protein [Marinomonas sp. TW1]|uniref:lipid A deacylase LpxR family protein n=1 Tax=Marinomonas sp. TW1 TaxID=1561203 RepID=UPI000A86C252|nr:lipid A deacylase LpxR family protein [Marinomonas sp. TW1]